MGQAQKISLLKGADTIHKVRFVLFLSACASLVPPHLLFLYQIALTLEVSLLNCQEAPTDRRSA